VSALGNAALEYLQVRRALGFKLRQQGRMLLQFVDFLDQRGAAVITTELALEWARQPAGGSQMWWHQRLAVVRGFAQHLAASDPRTEVPSSDLLPARPHRAVDPSSPRAGVTAQGRDLRDADRAFVRDRDARRRGDRA